MLTCRAIGAYLQGKWCPYLRLEVGLNQRSAMFRGVDKESSEEMDLRPVLNISSLFSYLTKTNRFRDIASTTALQLPHNTVTFNRRGDQNGSISFSAPSYLGTLTGGLDSPRMASHPSTPLTTQQLFGLATLPRCRERAQLQDSKN